MSAFDRDFAPVEETVILDDVTFKLIQSYEPTDDSIRKEHRLLVVTPDGEETAYPIRGEVTLGRSEDNHIVLKEDRSVSSRHMAVNTDGQLYWYQDLESRHGTFVNGERQTGGWLVGNEEIIIGNSRVYFLLPEIEIPEGTEELERKFEEEEALAEEADNPDQTMEGASPEKSEEEEETVSNVAVFLALFVMLLALGAGAYWYLFLSRSDLDPVAQVTDAAADKNNQLNRAMELYEKGQKHLKAKEWKQADRLLKLSASEIPEGNPLRAKILKSKAKVARELYASGLLKRARELYWDKPAEAIRLLHKFPADSSSRVEAKKLKDRIYKKEIAPKLGQVKAFLDMRKCDKAKEILQQIYKVDKKLKTVWVPKVERCAKEDPAIVIRSSSRKKRRTRRRGASSISEFKRGLAMYRSGRYTSAWVFFRRQRSSARKSWLRRRAGKYSRAVKSFERNYRAGRAARRRGSASRALTYFLRALRADRTLGGGRARLIKPSLGSLYYKRGDRSYRSKRYLAAYKDFQRARGYGYRKASAGIARVRRKAADFFKQAEALKGIADDEARRMYKKVVTILPSSHPLARRARQNL